MGTVLCYMCVKPIDFYEALVHVDGRIYHYECYTEHVKHPNYRVVTPDVPHDNPKITDEDTSSGR